jgi:hypothetical protein
VKFIEDVVADMTASGDSFDAIVAWKNHVCPRLCQSIQQRVCDIILQNPNKEEELLSSDVLSKAQMFFLQRCLPTTVFFNKNNDSNSDENGWLKLYSSAHQGISINRFETNCFDYKGATFNIFS